MYPRMEAQMTNHKPATALPKLSGEFDSLSGPDQTRCRNVLRWLIDEGALDASICLTTKPFVAVVHRSGWVSSEAPALLRELGELQ
jgi:hypothetical protein